MTDNIIQFPIGRAKPTKAPESLDLINLTSGAVQEDDGTFSAMVVLTGFKTAEDALDMSEYMCDAVIEDCLDADMEVTDSTSFFVDEQVDNFSDPDYGDEDPDSK